MPLDSQNRRGWCFRVGRRHFGGWHGAGCPRRVIADFALLVLAAAALAFRYRQRENEVESGVSANPYPLEIGAHELLTTTVFEDRALLRSHTCGELRAAQEGQQVTLCGWVDSYRDRGKKFFVDLRDRYGKTQVVFDPDVGEAQLALSAARSAVKT